MRASHERNTHAATGDGPPQTTPFDSFSVQAREPAHEAGACVTHSIVRADCHAHGGAHRSSARTMHERIIGAISVPSLQPGRNYEFRQMGKENSHRGRRLCALASRLGHTCATMGLMRGAKEVRRGERSFLCLRGPPGGDVKATAWAQVPTLQGRVACPDGYDAYGGTASRVGSPCPRGPTSIVIQFLYAATRPVGCVYPIPHKSMKRRIRPCDYGLCVPMFNWIEMNIVGVACKVVGIA